MGIKINFSRIFRKSLSSFLALLMIVDLGSLNVRPLQAQSLPTQTVGNVPSDIFSTLDQPALQVNMRQGKTFEGKQGFQLILIRDLHVQEEAQEKIALSLQQIHKATGINKVFLEGAEGKISSMLYQAFPHSDVRRKVAKEFVKEGYLTGAEFAAIDLGLENSIELYGVEDTQVYLQNLKAFRESRNLSEEYSSEIGEIDQRIQNAKENLFSQTLLSLDKMRQDLRGKDPDLQKVLQGCEKILIQRNTPSLNRWENLKNLNEIITLTKSVNQDLIHKELGQLIEGLEKNLAKEDLKEVVSKTLQFRLGRIETSDFLDNLRAIYLKHGGTESSFHEKYAHLESWHLLASKQEALNMELVWKELDQLVSELLEEYASQEKMEEWVSLGEEWSIIRKLLALELTRAELERVKSWDISERTNALSAKLASVKTRSNTPSNVHLFSNLNSALATALHFYRLAESRDSILVAKTLGYFSEKNDAGVLITGGFHTEGIQRLLEEKGISYVTWTPKVSELKGNRYEEIMMDSQYNLDNIDFSDKRLAWYGNSSEVMKMLSIPVLLGQILASINPKGYDALKMSWLEKMIEAGRKVDPRSINAVLQDWLSQKDINVLNFLKRDDLHRLVRAIGSLYPEEVFLNLAKMEAKDADAGKLAIRAVARGYQKTYSALVALTKAYFKIVKDQKQTAEKTESFIGQARQDQSAGNAKQMVLNSLEAAKLWGKFAVKYPNDTDARLRVLHILNAVTLPEVLDLYPEGPEAFQIVHRLLVRIQKAVPGAVEIQEALVKNGLNEILYAFKKAEASMVSSPRDASEALEKLKRKIDRFTTAREADLKAHPDYQTALEETRQKAEFNILRADLQALLLEAGQPDKAEGLPKGIKSFLAKATYLANTYPKTDEAVRILSPISTDSKFQSPGLASLKEGALRVQSDWINQYFEDEFARFLNILRLPKDFISYLANVSGKETSALDMIDFAMFLADEHERPLRESALPNIDGGLAVRDFAESNYSFYALSKWAEANPAQAKEVFENMIIKEEVPAEATPATAAAAPSLLDKDGYLPDDVLQELIETPVAQKAPPAPKARPLSIKEISIRVITERAQKALDQGELHVAASTLSRVDEELEKDPRIVSVMKNFYGRVIREMERLWAENQNKLDVEDGLFSLRRLIGSAVKVPLEADPYVDMNFEFMALRGNVENLAKAAAAYQAGLKYTGDGFIELAEAELGKIRQLMTASHVMYTDLQRVIGEKKNAAVEGQLEVILSQADQALAQGLSKDDLGEIRNAMLLWENAVRVITVNSLDEEKHQLKALKDKQDVFRLFLQGMEEMNEGQEEKSVATLSESAQLAKELFTSGYINEKAFDAVLHKQAKTLLEWGMTNFRRGVEEEKSEFVQASIKLFEQASELMARNTFEYAQLKDAWIENALLDDQISAMYMLVRAFELSGDEARDAFQKAYEMSKAFDAADRRLIEKLAVAYRLPRMITEAENFTRDALHEDSAPKADIAYEAYVKIRDLVREHQIVVIRTESGTLSVEQLQNRLEMTRALKEGHEKRDSEVLLSAQKYALHAGLSKDDLDLILDETDKDFLKEDEIEELHPIDLLLVFAANAEEKPEKREAQFADVTPKLFEFVNSPDKSAEALTELSLIFDYWLDASYAAFLTGDTARSAESARKAELIAVSLAAEANIRLFAGKLAQDLQRLRQRMVHQNRLLKPLAKKNLASYHRSTMALKVRFASTENEVSFREGEAFLKDVLSQIPDLINARDFTFAGEIADLAQDFVTAMKKFVPQLTDEQLGVLKANESELGILERLVKDAANMELDLAKIEDQIQVYAWTNDDTLLEPSAVTAAAILNSGVIQRMPAAVKKNLTERASFVLFQAIVAAKERAEDAMSDVARDLETENFIAAGLAVRRAEKWTTAAVMYRGLVADLSSMLADDLRDKIQTLELSRDVVTSSVEQIFKLAVADAKAFEAAFVASEFKNIEALAGLNNAFHTAAAAYIRLTRIDANYGSLGGKLFAPFYDLMIHLQSFAAVQEETSTGGRTEVGHGDSYAYAKGQELAGDVLNILDSVTFLPEMNWVDEDHFIIQELTMVMKFYAMQSKLMMQRKRVLNSIEMAGLELSEILDMRTLPDVQNAQKMGELLAVIEAVLKDTDIEMEGIAFDRLIRFLTMFTYMSQQLLHQGHVNAAQTYFNFIGRTIAYYEQRYFVSIFKAERQGAWDELKSIFSLHSRGIRLLENDKLKETVDDYRTAAARNDFDVTALSSFLEDLAWFSAYFPALSEESDRRNAREAAIALRDILAKKAAELKVTDTELMKNLEKAEKNLGLIEGLQKEWAEINEVIDRYVAEGLIGPQENLIPERLEYMMGFAVLKEDARASFNYFVHSLTKKAEAFLAQEEPGVHEPAEQAYILALVTLGRMRTYASDEEKPEIDKQIAAVKKSIAEIIPFEALELIEEEAEEKPIPLVTRAEPSQLLVLLEEDVDLRELNDDVEEVTQKRKVEDILIGAFREYPKTADFINGVVADFVNKEGFLYTLDLVVNEENPTPLADRLAALSKPYFENVLPEIERQLQTALAEKNDAQIENLLILALRLNDAMHQIYERHGFTAPENEIAFQQANSKLLSQALNPYADRKVEEAQVLESQHAKSIYERLVYLYQYAVQFTSREDLQPTVARLNNLILHFNNPVGGRQIIELKKIVSQANDDLDIVDEGFTKKPAPDATGVAGTLMGIKAEIKKALELIEQLDSLDVKSTEYSDARRSWIAPNHRVDTLLRRIGKGLHEKAKESLGKGDANTATEILKVSGKIVTALNDQDEFASTQKRLQTLTGIAVQVPDMHFKYFQADELEPGQAKQFYDSAVAVLKAIRQITELVGPNAVYEDIVKKAAHFAYSFAKQFAQKKEYDEAYVVYTLLISYLDDLKRVKYAIGSFDDVYVDLRGQIETSFLALELEIAKLEFQTGDVSEGRNRLTKIVSKAEDLISRYKLEGKPAEDLINDTESSARVLLVKVKIALSELTAYSGYKGRLAAVDREDDLFKLANTFKEVFEVIQKSGRNAFLDILTELRRRGVQAHQYKNSAAKRYFEVIQSLTADIKDLDPIVGEFHRESSVYLSSTDPKIALENAALLESARDIEDISPDEVTELDNDGNPIVLLTQSMQTGGNFDVTPQGQLRDKINLPNQAVNFSIRGELGRAELAPDETRLSGNVLSVKPGEIQTEIAKASADRASVDNVLVELNKFLSSPEYLALDEKTRVAFESTRVVILNNKLSLADDKTQGISYAHYGEGYGIPTVFFGAVLVQNLIKNDPASFAVLIRMEMNRRLYRAGKKKDSRTTLQVAKDAGIGEAALGQLVQSISKIEFENIDVPETFFDALELTVVEDVSPDDLSTLLKAANHFALTPEGNIANRKSILDQAANAIVKGRMDSAKINPDQTVVQGDILSVKASQLSNLTEAAQGASVDGLLEKLAAFIKSDDYQALDPAIKTAFESTRVVIFRNEAAVARNEKGISYAHYGEDQGPTVFLGGKLVEKLLAQDPKSLAMLIRIEMNRKLYRVQNPEDLRSSREVARDARIGAEELDKLQELIIDTEVEALLSLPEVEEAIKRGAETANLLSTAGTLVEKAKGLFLNKLVEAMGARMEAKEAGALKEAVSGIVEERGKTDSAKLAKNLVEVLASYPAAQAVGLNRLTGDVVVYLGSGQSQVLKLSDEASQILQNVLDRQNFGQDYVVLDLVKNLKANTLNQFIQDSMAGLTAQLGSVNESGNLSVRRTENFVLLSQKGAETGTEDIQSGVLSAFDFFEAQFVKQNNPVAIEADLLRSLPVDELKRFIQQYGRRLALKEGEEIEGLTKEELRPLWKNWSRYTAIQDTNYKVAILAKDSQPSGEMQGGSFLRIDAGQVSALGYVTKFGAYVADVGKEKAKIDPVANEMLRKVLKVLYSEGQIPAEILEETPFEKILENPEGFLFPPVKINTVSSEIESLLRAKSTVEAMA